MSNDSYWSVGIRVSRLKDHRMLTPDEQRVLRVRNKAAVGKRFKTEAEAHAALAECPDRDWYEARETIPLTELNSLFR